MKRELLSMHGYVKGKPAFCVVNLLPLWRKISFKSGCSSTWTSIYECRTIIADTHRQTLYCSLRSRPVKMSSTSVNWDSQSHKYSVGVQSGHAPILLCRTSRTLRRSSRGGTGGFLGLFGLPCTKVLLADFMAARSSSTYGAISMRATDSIST